MRSLLGHHTLLTSYQDQRKDVRTKSFSPLSISSESTVTEEQPSCTCSTLNETSTFEDGVEGFTYRLTPSTTSDPRALVSLHDPTALSVSTHPHLLPLKTPVPSGVSTPPDVHVTVWTFFLHGNVQERHTLTVRNRTESKDPWRFFSWTSEDLDLTSSENCKA